MGGCLPRERADPELEGGGALGGSEGFLGPCRAGQDVARGILIGSVGKVCVRQAPPRWNAVDESGDCGGSLLGRPNQAAAQIAAEESVSCRGWATVGGVPALGRWACGLWGRRRQPSPCGSGGLAPGPPPPIFLGVLQSVGASL